MIDNQIIKTTASGRICAYDAGKKIKGRKRIVHAADIEDRDGAMDGVKAARFRFPWLRHVFGDSSYAGDKLRDVLARMGKGSPKIIKQSDTAKGFELLRRRWVAEPTFACLGRCRRLAKDWETSPASSIAWTHIASIRMLMRRTVRYCCA